MVLQRVCRNALLLELLFSSVLVARVRRLIKSMAVNNKWHPTLQLVLSISIIFASAINLY